MTDTTEPAIPILAAVPVKALRELVNEIERWPQAQQRGVVVSWGVTQQGIAVAATVKLHDEIDLSVIATRTLDGEFGIGGQFRWVPRQ